MTKIVIGPKEYGVLRDPAVNDVLDPRTDINELRNGWMSDMWGAKLFVRKDMAGKAALFSQGIALDPD